MDKATPDDSALPAVTREFLKVLDDVAENARHAADPRQPTSQLAEAFAAYLRAPDEVVV